MEALLQPHVGLMFWTIVTFLTLVGVLGRFLWGPIVQALEKREEGVRRTLEETESARRAAEEIRTDLDAQRAAVAREHQAMLQQARQEAERIRAQLLEQSRLETEAMIQKGRADLAAEKAKVTRELRRDVVELSLKATETLLKKEVTPAVREQFAKDFDRDLDRRSGDLN